MTTRKTVPVVSGTYNREGEGEIEVRRGERGTKTKLKKSKILKSKQKVNFSRQTPTKIPELSTSRYSLLELTSGVTGVIEFVQ